MAATMLLEKTVTAEKQPQERLTGEKLKLTCTCGRIHMASHNAVCPACSAMAGRSK